MPQPFLYSLIDKAVFDYKLIEKGDRILLGASGGKDSCALAEYFSNRKKRLKSDFEFSCLHIKSDFSAQLPNKIIDLFKTWNADLHIIEADIIHRLKEGRKMNCYWCSAQRRTELIKYALCNGFNKIALGHHLDDILETLIMNSLNKGVFSTMPPVLKYKKYPITIIRPLCYSTEENITAHAELNGFLGYTCTCTYQNNSSRKDARKRLEALVQGDQSKKEKLFCSLKKINHTYLP